MEGRWQWFYEEMMMVESKMGCDQREVRWREDGNSGMERKRAQRWRWGARKEAREKEIYS